MLLFCARSIARVLRSILRRLPTVSVQCLILTYPPPEHFGWEPGRETPRSSARDSQCCAGDWVTDANCSWWKISTMGGQGHNVRIDKARTVLPQHSTATCNENIWCISQWLMCRLIVSVHNQKDHNKAVVQTPDFKAGRPTRTCAVLVKLNQF